MVYEFMSLNPGVEVLNFNETISPFFIIALSKKLACLYIRATDISQTLERFFDDMVYVFTAIQAIKFLVVNKPQFFLGTYAWQKDLLGSKRNAEKCPIILALTARQ